MTLGVLDAFFGVVQLAPWWGGDDTLASNNEIAKLRVVEQVSILSVRHTACASAIDGGQAVAPAGCIHAQNKQIVGTRMSAAVLNNLYGTSLDAIGPTYVTARASDGMSVVVTLDNVGKDGIVIVHPALPGQPYANSSVCPPGVDPVSCEGFAILGSDGVWYPAVATHGDVPNQILLVANVTNTTSVVPVGTRNGWAGYPVVNVYSSSMLPAYPWNAFEHECLNLIFFFVFFFF